MPRQPRIISSTGIYHTTLRSVNQHIIFEEEEDYHKFLFILEDCKTKHEVDILAYCLMDNHIHLLLYSLPSHLSSFFQSLGSRFVRWYNNKYSRSGHLFQDRFYSTTIEDNTHYLSALTYIHNNPVRAKMCRFPSEYRWSSYNAFFGQKNSIINTLYSYSIAGSKESLLKIFSNQNSSSDIPDNHGETRHFLTDNQALLIFGEVTHLPSTSAVVSLPKKKRNEYIRTLKEKGLTQKQIARVMDVSTSTVKRICLS